MELINIKKLCLYKPGDFVQSLRCQGYIWSGHSGCKHLSSLNLFEKLEKGWSVCMEPLKEDEFSNFVTKEIKVINVTDVTKEKIISVTHVTCICTNIISAAIRDHLNVTNVTHAKKMS